MKMIYDPPGCNWDDPDAPRLESKMEELPHRRTKIPTVADGKAHDLIKGKLREIAIDTLYTLSEPMDPEELYGYLIPPGDYETMVDASLLMPRVSNWSTDNLHLHTDFLNQIIEYSLNYKSTVDQTHTQWLWSRYLNNITPESKLGEKLIPLVDIAIQWSTTLELFSMFRKNGIPISLTVHMLPWLRAIVPSLYSDSNDPLVFRALKEYVEAKTPRYIPGVSKWFKGICGYGTELIAFYRIIKDKPKPPPLEDSVIIVPVLDDGLHEDGLTDHFNEFYHAYQREKAQRKLKSTITGQTLDAQWNKPYNIWKEIIGPVTQ
jgi:hypothetical protein